MRLAQLFRFSIRLIIGLTLFSIAQGSALADVKLPNIFSDHMVLQRDQKDKVWGLAEPGESVTVSIAQQTQRTVADAAGQWQIFLEPLPAGGPHTLTVKGKNEIIFRDVLVGEVWICAGQSNMELAVKEATDPDLEILAAKYPKIRMINYPNLGSQEPVWTHDAQWQVCSPETVGEFSAVGYFFAQQVHQSIDVPIGMINNSWGGTVVEAWIRMDLLKADPRYQPLLDKWTKRAARLAELSAKREPTEEEQAEIKKWTFSLGSHHRPANVYNGILKSHLGYGIRGAIWYQGESNVIGGRSYQYRYLFPLMIQNWRDDWGQGDFPFYWVQMPDEWAEVAEPGDSVWAELRESQTMTMSKLPKTGQAVIIDKGEAKDGHPPHKFDVGRRLARWALANDYGIEIAYRSPQYKSMQQDGNKIVLIFDYVGSGWRPFDVAEPRGFAIAGEDNKFVHAQARILPDNRIEVWSDAVTKPFNVRYGWADNPVVNMYNNDGLPLTPFRTDDLPLVTVGKDF